MQRADFGVNPTQTTAGGSLVVSEERLARVERILTQQMRDFSLLRHDVTMIQRAVNELTLVITQLSRAVSLHNDPIPSLVERVAGF